MREKSPVNALRLALSELPGAEVIKHADAATGGIPDLSVTYNGRTSWLEVKLLRRGQTLESELEPRQLATCRRLERASGARCWIVAFRRPGTMQHTLIYRPTRIRTDSEVCQQVAPAPSAKVRLVLPPVRETYTGIGSGNLIELATVGVLALRGFAYPQLVNLIQETHR